MDKATFVYKRRQKNGTKPATQDVSSKCTETSDSRDGNLQGDSGYGIKQGCCSLREIFCDIKVKSECTAELRSGQRCTLEPQERRQQEERDCWFVIQQRETKQYKFGRSIRLIQPGFKMVGCWNRNKTVQPPADFIEEKRAMFAEIDAFELESEEESPVTCRVYSAYQSDFGGENWYRQGGLDIVPEGGSEEVSGDSLSAALSAALRTPGAERHESVRSTGESAENDPWDSLISGFRYLEVDEEFHDDDKGELILSGNKTGADLSILNVLLEECNQTYPISLRSAISHFCDIERVSKLGEGTFGEAFKGNSCVFKIVPMDGETLVNGETQKTCAEIYSEVLLTKTLARLRGIESGDGTRSLNMCTNFIETKSTFICQGKYEEDLIKAWEEWDGIRGSENDHPMIFSPKQLYVVFVLADGGIDLESFVLFSFSEARSILLQVALALATAEEACGFEHRDLHWGNIVVVRDYKIEYNQYRLEGKDLKLKSSGVFVSIIDFTLSRIDTGNQVFFCNLSNDPEIFKGPKQDLQSETYRRMMKLTGGQWERSFPKTNCLWIHYVADILVNKKTYPITSKEKRSLRSFCKRALLYESAKAASSDDFFDDLKVP